METEEVFASIRYEGELVQDGFLDARKSGEALIGIDESLRYFLFQENPSFQKMEFELPVRIRKGSWEAYFPENIDMLLLKTSLAWGATKYFGTALGEMAKADFKDFGFKDVFKKSFKGLTWVVKIALHLGSLTKKKLGKVLFSKNNQKVGITNEQGEEMWVPVEYIELYANCPPRIFSSLAKVIEVERDLVINYHDGDDKGEVRVNPSHKFIFTSDEEEETLFPELKHNDFVELSGHITRGNENSNTIGFYYNNHVLTCYPDKGNITDYKEHIFSNCILKGYVDRMRKDGEIIERRPRIRFIEVESIEPNSKQSKLFD